MKCGGLLLKTSVYLIVLFLFGLSIILGDSLSYLANNNLTLETMEKYEQANENEYSSATTGLQAIVRLPQTRFAVGKAIVPIFIIKNLSERRITIWQCGFWCNHLVIVKNANGKAVPLTDLGKITRQRFSPDGPRRKNLPIYLAPGSENEVVIPQSLTAIYELSKTGNYTIQIIYEDRGEGWQGRLPSNVLKFEIFAN